MRVRDPQTGESPGSGNNLMTDLDIAVALLKRLTFDGVPFEQTYLDAGMVFTEADIEGIRFEGNEVRVLYWWGNSNLYWTFTKDEWQSEIRRS